MLLYSQKFPEHVELWTHSNLQLNDLKLRFDAKTSNPSITASGWVQSNELLDKCCLSSSIGSQKTKQFTIINLQVNVFICNFRFSTLDSRIYFSNILGYEWVFLILLSIHIIDHLSLIFGILVFQFKLLIIFVCCQL